jgi:hypothetical protein
VQGVEEHAIGLLTSLEARDPKKLVGRVLALIRESKGKDDGIGLEMLKEKGVCRDRPTHTDLVGLLAIKIPQN